MTLFLLGSDPLAPRALFTVPRPVLALPCASCGSKGPHRGVRSSEGGFVALCASCTCEEALQDAWDDLSHMLHAPSSAAVTR